MSYKEEAPGQTQGLLERLYLSAGWGTSWRPPGSAGEGGWGERILAFSAQTVVPRTPTQKSNKKMD